MGTIRAVVVDPTKPGSLDIREVGAPRPVPNEALVRIAATSLNRGEVRGAQHAQPGARIGWDLAGAVEQPAADGSGPAVGTRVVGLLPTGAWSEVVAVPTGALAVLPDGVSFAQAATLPVAGLTALYTVEHGGSLVGKSVLVTGASGGVGHLAVRIVRLAGGRAVGLVHHEAHATLVREAGADEVAAGEDASAAAAFSPYDLILDSVGGRTLGTALTLLAPEGICVSFGSSESGAVTFEPGRFFRNGGSTLYGFYLFYEVRRRPAGKGLARLAGLIADGPLTPHIAVEAPWTDVGRVAKDLLDRRFVGKAVLRFGG
jgi:NADPH:quinone reductase